MQFRVHDLAAERSVWSVSPIDMVPLKLRGEKLMVRAFDAGFTVIAIPGGRQINKSRRG